MALQQTLLLLGIAALVAAIADEVARQTSRRSGLLAAGPFLLIAGAPIVPNQSVALGFSLDDVLPVVGLVLMLPLVPWSRLRSIRWGPRPGALVALVGVLVMILAGAVSALLVADGPGDVVRLSIRGSGRMAFLLAVVVCVAILGSDRRLRRFSALAIAAVGSFQAVFGLVAYFVGLPGGAGLEAPRGSILVGEVPGRISGTIGNSPNFTAAILMMSIVITVGLALRAGQRRDRAIGWALATVQLIALALTYTRVSLGLTVVALVILVVLRSRPILIVPITASLVPIALFTPMIERILSDVPDRLALWTSAWLLMIDNPVHGVGAGQMLAAVEADPERYRDTVFGGAWSTAHNTVLLAGAETGVIGALGALILNVGLIAIAIQAFRAAAPGARGHLQVASALALGAFVAQGMVNNLFTVGVTGLCAAFLIGSQLVDARTAPVVGPQRVEGGLAVQRSWAELLRDAWGRVQGSIVRPSSR